MKHLPEPRGRIAISRPGGGFGLPWSPMIDRRSFVVKRRAEKSQLPVYPGIECVGQSPGRQWRSRVAGPRTDP
jgi:hypothetical protein